jgi:hypothetical protein
MRVIRNTLIELRGVRQFLILKVVRMRKYVMLTRLFIFLVL